MDGKIVPTTATSQPTATAESVLGINLRDAFWQWGQCQAQSTPWRRPCLHAAPTAKFATYMPLWTHAPGRLNPLPMSPYSSLLDILYKIQSNQCSVTQDPGNTGSNHGCLSRPWWRELEVIIYPGLPPLEYWLAGLPRCPGTAYEQHRRRNKRQRLHEGAQVQHETTSARLRVKKCANKRRGGRRQVITTSKMEWRDTNAAAPGPPAFSLNSPLTSLEVTPTTLAQRRNIFHPMTAVKFGLWPWPLNLTRAVTLNHARYLGQWSFRLDVFVRTRGRHTQYTGQIALLGPLKWSVAGCHLEYDMKLVYGYSEKETGRWSLNQLSWWLLDSSPTNL